jgi:hypothetical protein
LLARKGNEHNIHGEQTIEIMEYQSLSLNKQSFVYSSKIVETSSHQILGREGFPKVMCYDDHSFHAKDLESPMTWLTSMDVDG